MDISKVDLIYFSPTGTTKKTLEGIAEGIQAESVVDMNLTLPEASEPTIGGGKDEIVIIGAPVYGGRVPGEAVKRLKRISGNGNPVVAVVVYGNRAYDNALFELKHIAEEIGFVTVAGAAFIGEHSFASEEFPIAMGRPDETDVEKAVAFGKSIRAKMASVQSLDEITSPEVPGEMPPEGGGMPPSEECPQSKEELCTTCGTCADVCPTGAITVSDTVVTDGKKCIKCCACVKNCPNGARIMTSERIAGAVKWLSENFKRRAEPELFL